MTTVKLACEKEGATYREYTITGVRISGRCVVEKYAEGWNLELMNVTPERQGYGSLLLAYVRKAMGVPLSVCPVTDASKAFFTKHGMTADYVLP
ncbi:Hypothetical protein POVN_LOCUS199 [uncultured virus]|nr:Hypothetical protein POVN_LOCUS199 [uncultured virus]